MSHTRESKIVCQCLGITEAEITRAIEEHRIATLKRLIEHTAAGGGCMACHPLLRDYLCRAPEAASKKRVTSLSPSARTDNSQAQAL